MVLVHQDVAVAVLEGVGDVFLRDEEFVGAQEQVAEVHGVVLAELGLVGLEHGNDAAFEEALGDRLVGAGIDPVVLELIEFIGHRLGSHDLVAHAGLLQRLLDDRVLVAVVEDREAWAQPDAVTVLAQKLRAHRVEGGNPKFARVDAAALEQPLDALLHFARRLVRKGDGQDLAREGSSRFDELNDPLGQNPRLPRARAGQDKDGTVEGFYGGLLLRIQPDGHPLCSRTGGGVFPGFVSSSK